MFEKPPTIPELPEGYVYAGTDIRKVNDAGKRVSWDIAYFLPTAIVYDNGSAENYKDWVCKETGFHPEGPLPACNRTGDIHYAVRIGTRAQEIMCPDYRDQPATVYKF